MSLPDDERDTSKGEKPEDEEEVEESDDLEDESDGEDSSEGDEDSENDSDDEDSDLDPERLLRTVRNQRKVEKTQSRRIRELERENKQFKRSKQSKDEQLASDLEERESRISELEGENKTLTEQVQRSSFIEKMGAAGFTARQARIAWKDRDEFSVEPEFSDSRQLTNAKAIRKAAKEFDAEFYATGSADGGTRERGSGGKSGGAGMNDMIRGAAGR